MIPNLIPPHDDELFCSYISRLSSLNGCRNMKNFIGRLLLGKTDCHIVAHINWNYDGWGLFAPFFHTTDTDPAPFITGCSLYPYLAVFLTPHRQAMVVDQLFNSLHAKKTQKIVPLLSSVKYCKQCREEEAQEYGYSYLHRAHQLPGVTVCHKHHTPLYDANNNTPIAVTPDAVAFAEFSNALLQKRLQTDISIVQQATIPRLNGPVPGLSIPLETIIKDGFYSSKHTRIPDVVRILIHTYGSVNNLQSCIKPDNDTVLRFIDRTTNEYTVYQPFSNTIIQMKHNACGNVFFTTPTGFLAGWTCPFCASKKVVHSHSFQDEVAALTGDEYTVTGLYKGRNQPIEIRHNTCGHTQTYLPKHFLDGSRCPKCTKIFSRNRIADIVDYMTYGQYQITRACGKNLFEIKEENGAVLEISIQKFLQEILRPTPSNILSVPVRHLRTDWETQIWDTNNKPSRISKKDMYQYIQSLYKSEELIFMEDLKKCFPDNYYKMLKSSVRSLIDAKKLFRVETGIYTQKKYPINPKRLIEQKYLVRNGTRIGIPDSKTLAYEMGLSVEKPDILYIMTNKESQPHGRKRVINGIPVHLRGNKIIINDDNYLYIMALEAIKYCWHYDAGRDYRIPEFIKKHNLSLNMFLSLLPSYTENVQKQFTAIWKKVTA